MIYLIGCYFTSSSSGSILDETGGARDATGSLDNPALSVIINCKGISIFILEHDQDTICKIRDCKTGDCKTGEAAMGDKSPKNKEKKKKKQLNKKDKKKEQAGSVSSVTRA